ncbi:MAG: hypothetical protein ACE365_07225 [Gammaproteobacteria bacterium]
MLGRVPEIKYGENYFFNSMANGLVSDRFKLHVSLPKETWLRSDCNKHIKVISSLLTNATKKGLISGFKHFNKHGIEHQQKIAEIQVLLQEFHELKMTTNNLSDEDQLTVLDKFLKSKVTSELDRYTGDCILEDELEETISIESLCNNALEQRVLANFGPLIYLGHMLQKDHERFSFENVLAGLQSQLEAYNRFQEGDQFTVYLPDNDRFWSFPAFKDFILLCNNIQGYCRNQGISAGEIGYAAGRISANINFRLEYFSMPYDRSSGARLHGDEFNGDEKEERAREEILDHLVYALLSVRYQHEVLHRDSFSDHINSFFSEYNVQTDEGVDALFSALRSSPPSSPR